LYDILSEETTMARVTISDCLEQVDNRFLIIQMAIKRVKQFREGYKPLVECRNKEVVCSLREIAAGKVLPVENVDHSLLEDEALAL
jgi:DNA-directed RNA polymerase subunit omega